MTAVKIAPFSGMYPALDPTELPERSAALSRDAWLYSGALQGIAAPKVLRTCVDSTATKVYRIPRGYTDKSHLANADWLEFEDPNTDVVRALIVDDTYDRYYWASPSAQPKYNTRARIQAGSAPFLLGIPAPSVAPSVTVSGGSGVTTSRSYVYTWVSAYGEEGPPSPPVVVNGFQNGTWNVTVTAAASGDLGTNRNLTKLRIYRTVTSSSGVATFFLVVEQAIATLTYADTQTDTVVSQNASLASTNWYAPPTDLQGWVAMPNGMLCGWRLNEVWFSEPYRPHAWPQSYVTVVDFPVVGLGVNGTSLIVCTQGNPFSLTGNNPSSITQSKIANYEPCMSRGSILSAPEGVFYASPNGIILVASGTATNKTQNFITKEAWQQLAPVPTLRAARLGAAYYAFGGAVLGVFDSGGFDNSAFTQADLSGSLQGIIIDPTNDRVLFNTLSASVPTLNVFNDPWSGELFIVRAGVVYWLDISDADPVRQPFLWRSKKFEASEKKNFAAMRVYFDVPDTAPALNPVRNTDLVQTLQADQYGLVRVYADDVLRETRELRTSGELMRLTSGYKADYWQFEIEARVKIKNIQVGTSAKALDKV